MRYLYTFSSMDSKFVMKYLEPNHNLYRMA